MSDECRKAEYFAADPRGAWVCVGRGVVRGRRRVWAETDLVAPIKIIAITHSVRAVRLSAVGAKYL